MINWPLMCRTVLVKGTNYSDFYCLAITWCKQFNITSVKNPVHAIHIFSLLHILFHLRHVCQIKIMTAALVHISLSYFLPHRRGPKATDTVVHCVLIARQQAPLDLSGLIIDLIRKTNRCLIYGDPVVFAIWVAFAFTRWIVLEYNNMLFVLLY